MNHAGIFRAWGALLVLSAATTILTIVSAPSATIAAGLLLGLSGLKARIILSRYLELHRSVFWMKVFDIVIGLFLLIAFILFAAASGRVP